MNYRGYKCNPKYSESDHLYYGYIEGLAKAGKISAATMDDFILLYHNTVDDHIATHKSRKKAGWWIFLLVLIGLVVGAVATCPDKEKHIAVLSDKMGDALMGESNSNNSGLDALSSLLGKGLAKLTLSSQLIVDDYIVVSVGKIEDSEGNSQVVSIGIFGHILTASREQMRERAKEKLSL